jgi:hypothetical protein
MEKVKENALRAAVRRGRRVGVRSQFWPPDLNGPAKGAPVTLVVDGGTGAF